MCNKESETIHCQNVRDMFIVSKPGSHHLHQRDLDNFEFEDDEDTRVSAARRRSPTILNSILLSTKTRYRRRQDTHGHT